MKIKSPIVHISVMMLARKGVKNNSQSTLKLSMPIPIPVSKKLENDTLTNYDEYDNSIPKYGSAETSAPILSIKKQSLYNKCSESSDFPNQPFGKSPPDKRYMTSIYLNMVANNNLRRSFVEN